MGFFGALGKIVAGKPVFEPEDNPAQNGQSAEDTSGTLPVRPSEDPVVRIKRVECRPSGSRLDVYADIHNEAGEPVFLDKILLMGTQRELDSQLNPGQSRQYLIYSGPLMTQPPKGFAEVHYRKQSDGDYFADYHEIRSRQMGEEGYEITELLMRGPVRDI